jgi:hypothetical protein
LTPVKNGFFTLSVIQRKTMQLGWSPRCRIGLR